MNLFSYNNVESKAEKASGFISLFSLNLYKLHLNLSKWSTDRTSEANPVRPTYNLSFTLKTYQIRLSKIINMKNKTGL